MHHSTYRIAHTTTFVTAVLALWLEWEITQWVHYEGLTSRPTAPWADTLPTACLEHKVTYRQYSFLAYQNKQQDYILNSIENIPPVDDNKYKGAYITIISIKNINE